MIIRYQLNQENYPTIPCVHDCVIKEVKIQDNFLTFYFEDDISYHDSIKYYNPKAKTLQIRYHLTDDFEVFAWKRKLALIRHEGYYAVDKSKLIDMTKNELVYLYHYVRYGEMILKLVSQYTVIIDLVIDYVEYEWIE